MEYQLNIGDVVTSGSTANYTCFGLGSCIGLFMQDRVTGLTGGAHILLPDDETVPLGTLKFYSVQRAIDEILRRMKVKGSSLTTLRAKVTGGANVIGATSEIGGRNIESVVANLRERKIFLAAMDVGGTYCRTARFESQTGLLQVRLPQLNQYKTY
jgi:chemotaxis protein CheD